MWWCVISMQFWELNYSFFVYKKNINFCHESVIFIEVSSIMSSDVLKFKKMFFKQMMNSGTILPVKVSAFWKYSGPSKCLAFFVRISDVYVTKIVAIKRCVFYRKQTVHWKLEDWPSFEIDSLNDWFIL